MPQSIFPQAQQNQAGWALNRNRVNCLMLTHATYYNVIEPDRPQLKTS